MSEPLAATLLVGRRSSRSSGHADRRTGPTPVAPAGSSRALCSGRGDGPAGVPRRRLPAGSSSSPAGSQDDWRRGTGPGGDPARRASSSSSPPGRSATPSRSTASCRSRPAAARCCSPAPTCPRTGTRKRSAPRWSPATRGSSTRPTPSACGSSRSSPGSPRSATRTWKPTRRSRGWAREQLWDDVSEEPLEYAGFVAAKVGRIWSHGPRDVMREPVWAALHWALVGFGLLGLGLLAWRRRWEALVLATVFLSITALSALLVASPRRVLVMLPLVAPAPGRRSGLESPRRVGPRRSRTLSPGRT